MKRDIRIPRVLQRPPQGWISLALLLGMLAVLGVSIADSRPLDLGGEARTSSFIVVMLAAGLIGFLLARSSIGVVRAHVIGATAGAIVLVLLAAAAVSKEVAILPADFTDLQARVMDLRLALDAALETWRTDSTQVPQEITFVVLGAICWTTAQFSAFSIFRYDRGGPAVMAIGVVLFLNVGLRATDQGAELLPVWPVLATYSVLAMLLLVRMQLSSQGKHWLRRHIADAGDVRRLFLRTGTAFVLISVLAASSMTIVAKAPAQDMPIKQLEDMLEDVGEQLAAWLPILGVPPTEPEQSTIDDRYPILDEWERTEGTAFRATFLDGSLRGNYWWLSAHSEFKNGRWQRRVVRSAGHADQERIPPGSSLRGPRHAIETRITVQQPLYPGMVHGSTEASAVSEAVDRTFIDDGVDHAGLIFSDLSEQVDTYTVWSDVLDYRDDGLGLTADELMASGDGYDEPWLSDYLTIHPGGTGFRTKQLAERIVEENATPYEQAEALQNHFLKEGFDYVTNLEGACDGLNTPECLLKTKIGFCQQYATTMAMVLREMGIPSRMIIGYLPGDEAPGNTWVVENAALHNWVEAWFPGYGWIRFDPTPGVGFSPFRTNFPPAPDPIDPGNDTQQTPGPTQPPDPPTPEPTFVPVGAQPEGGGDDDDGALAAFIIGGGIAGLLLIVTAGLLFTRLRRLPRGDGGLAFKGIVSLATRLGYAPHPSQTEYEYAQTLSEVVPDVRKDLFYVADVHVESAYGEHDVESERQQGLKGAYARIRTALLRLWMRARR